MSRTILEASVEKGMMVVVTGSSHVMYGPRGTGLPARISKKIPKKNQVVILLDPERQLIRREGEVPAADFLWYSAARPCNHNCFDRVEIARVMNAAGRTRDNLPQVTFFFGQALMYMMYGLIIPKIMMLLGIWLLLQFELNESMAS